MTKTINIRKDRDEINVTDAQGKLLLNIRVAASSRQSRADISVRTGQDELRIDRVLIAETPLTP